MLFLIQLSLLSLSFLSYVSVPDLDIVLCLILDLSFGQRSHLFPVLRIWSRIRLLLGLLDPDPIVRVTDPAPDPSIIKQK